MANAKQTAQAKTAEFDDAVEALFDLVNTSEDVKKYLSLLADIKELKGELSAYAADTGTFRTRTHQFVRADRKKVDYKAAVDKLNEDGKITESTLEQFITHDYAGIIAFLLEAGEITAESLEDFIEHKFYAQAREIKEGEGDLEVEA